MSDLIERVAAKAGWLQDVDGDWYNEIETASRLCTFAAELRPYGLVFLLRELLEAGWTLEKRRNGQYKLGMAYHERREGIDHFAYILEEAAMLAYLAMDDAHKGER